MGLLSLDKMWTVRALLLLGLAATSLADYARCSKDKNDCSCGDKSFDGCILPNPTVSLHVADLNECILNCALFHNRGPDENCKLHAQGESMEDYLGTCNF